MKKIHVITLFPKMFDSYMKDSILARAQKAEKFSLDFKNPRDFAADARRTVDDRAYGGGPGMVMMADPILNALADLPASKKRKIIILSPGGTQFTNAYADQLIKKYDDIVLVSGRYEGIDARVKKILRAEDVSIGDYTLTGGELPAMVIIDAIVRRLPGVLGNELSIEEKRPAAHETYTRPEVFEHKGKKYRVPKVLMSGDHKKIDEWRREH